MTEGLKKIVIRGLLSLEDVSLEPGRLTVLIGPNGAGKSNVLTALKMLPLIRTQSLQRFVGEAGGASALLHYGPKRTKAIELQCTFEDEKKQSSYDANLGFASGDKLLFLDENVSIMPDLGGEGKQFLGKGHWETQLQESSTPLAKSVSWWLGQMNFFHFHDTSLHSSLRTNAKGSDDRFLRSDGSNLAAFLLMLKESEEVSHAKAWRRINKLVRRVAPSVKELLPTPVSNGNGSVRLDWLDDQDESFGVHQLSDGTLRAIALITVLAQPTERLPKFMSIDEPELGLHPAAIRLLADLARSVSQHTQILFATQSTAFLDHFAPSEVVVVERHGGKTTLRQLEEEPLRSWLEDYSLSEIFDKGIIGGRP
jgi:predicted ATPase